MMSNKYSEEHTKLEKQNYCTGSRLRSESMLSCVLQVEHLVLLPAASQTLQQADERLGQYAP